MLHKREVIKKRLPGIDWRNILSGKVKTQAGSWLPSSQSHPPVPFVPPSTEHTMDKEYQNQSFLFIVMAQDGRAFLRPFSHILQNSFIKYFHF